MTGRRPPRRKRTDVRCPDLPRAGRPRLDVVGPDGIPACESAGQVAERLARQVDALTAEVEALARRTTAALGVLASQLGQIHVELDELAHGPDPHTAGADR